jgi:hypothetical protein
MSAVLVYSLLLNTYIHICVLVFTSVPFLPRSYQFVPVTRYDPRDSIVAKRNFQTPRHAR